MSSVTVVIPVYHDAEALARLVGETDWSGADVIVATAGDDLSIAPVRDAFPGLVWLDGPRGRARQMNAGAARAHGDWFLFLHADTRLPASWRDAIDKAEH